MAKKKAVTTVKEEVKEVAPVKNVVAKYNPATGKVDHECEKTYRTINMGGKAVKECRICGTRF